MYKTGLHCCPVANAANVRCAASSCGSKLSTSQSEYGALTVLLAAAAAQSMKRGRQNAEIFIAAG
jgi:hypothetical protein